MIPKNFLQNFKIKTNKYVNMIKKPNEISFKFLNFSKKDLFNTLSPSSFMTNAQLKEKLNFSFKNDLFKISLLYQNTEFNDLTINKCLEDKNFFPNLLLFHPFLQSVYNVCTFEKYQINFEREYVQLPDGGQISLDWAYSPQPMENKILFVIHGLTGGSEMPYVQSLVTEAQTQGFTTVVCHNRGINRTALTTPEPFHGVKLDDIEYAIKHIQKKYKNPELYGVGLSLGGNLLLRYAGNKKNEVEFKGLVAIATPFDIGQCLNNLSFVYEKFFLRRYIEQTLIPNLEMLKSLEKTHNIDFQKVINAKTLKDFHEGFTVKVFGYKNVEEYLEAAKVNEEHIKNISVPTLLLHAKDDPITTIKCVPVNALMHNKNIIYVETKNGGHVCWFYKTKPERVNFLKLLFIQHSF